MLKQLSANQPLFIEKDVSYKKQLLSNSALIEQFKIMARKLALRCELEIYERLPDLQDMMRLLQAQSSSNKEAGDQNQSLFNMIRQFEQEDSQYEASATGSSSDNSSEDNKQEQDSDTEEKKKNVQHKKKKKKMMLEKKKQSKESDQRQSVMMQVTKIKLRNLFQQKMIETQ